jgi:hypothetical protein
MYLIFGFLSFIISLYFTMSADTKRTRGVVAAGLSRGVGGGERPPPRVMQGVPQDGVFHMGNIVFSSEQKLMIFNYI